MSRWIHFVETSSSAFTRCGQDRDAACAANNGVGLATATDAATADCPDCAAPVGAHACVESLHTIDGPAGLFQCTRCRKVYQKTRGGLLAWGPFPL